MSYQTKNNFSAGKVDTDSAHEYVAPNTLVRLENFDLFNQGANFVAVPSKGNSGVTASVSGKEKTFLGSCEWRHKTYIFSTRVSDIATIDVFDSLTSVTTTVLQAPVADIGFPTYDDPNLKTYVLSAEVVDDTFLYWTWGVRQSDGSLEGYGEPKRINIQDAIDDPSNYSNFSGNYDRPEKLLVSSGRSSQNKNNHLKFGSYIFYKRYKTKYDEYTVLSYPSECISVTEGFGNDTLDNYISIGGFDVDDDVERVEILMSIDNSATFEIVKSVDTTITKSVSSFIFDNSNEYPVLSGTVSEVINNNYPLTATELTLADNRLVVGDIDTEYRFVDENGDALDKNTPFTYTTTGIFSGTTNVFPKATDTAGSINIAYAFTIGNTYRFTINGYKYNYSTMTNERHIYQFNWNYTSGATTDTSGIAYLFANANPSFTITPAPVTNFTVSGLNLGDGGLSGNTDITVDQIQGDNSSGLNADFRYKGAIVFMDDKARNAGATHVTDIFYSGDEWTFSVKPNLSASGITAPYWATKYMFVRDKVNTALQYGKLSTGTVASKSGYKYYKVENGLYVNYLADQRGNVVTMYSKSLGRDIETQVLTIEEKNDEGISQEGDEYIYIKSDITISGLVLYKPVKDVEAKTEVLYETSDIYTVSNGVFSGDTVDKLRWYDTKVGEYDDIPMVIMITDKVSLNEINHLGRAAYSYIEENTVTGKATIMASEQYTPESNFNGLSDLAFKYGNYIDLNRKYGAVEKLHYDETNLLIGQKRKWSRAPLGKSLLSTADGGSTLQVSGKFLNEPIVPVGGDYGISDKRSFAVFGFRKYFVDRSRGIIGRISMDGISPLNASREEEIVTLCGAHSPIDPIVGGFDLQKMEYIAAFHGSDTILRFSEKTKESVGNYKLQVMPYKYILLDTTLYSFPQTSDDILWKENVGLGGGTFYGNDEIKALAFISNTEPNMIKDWTSTSINGTIPSNDELLAGGVITLDIDIETVKNKTSLDFGSLHRREGVWYGDFMKDENSEGRAFYGVGTVDTVDSTTVLTTKSQVKNLNIGSDVYSGNSIIGTVESYTEKTITFDAPMSTTPSGGDYIHTVRSQKIEGESIKGNTALVTMYITDDYNRYFNKEMKIFSVTTTFNPSSNT